LKLLRRFQSWTPTIGDRQLIVPVAGRYLLALAVALGVVAIATRNPLLYLLESFLLAALLVSGVYAEAVLRSMTLRWTPSQAVAGEPCGDWIEIHNPSWLPISSLQIGVFEGSVFRVCAELPYLAARSKQTLRSQLVYSKRGYVESKKLAVATLYPFGLAERRRIFHIPLSRWVWPRRVSPTAKSALDVSVLSGSDPKEGELRGYLPGDPMKDVAWGKSKARGQLLVRPRARQEAYLQIADPGQWSESLIEECAALLYSRRVRELVVTGQRRLHWKTASESLQYLAERNG
jgi:uncharacterized protein (DUF58 family)